MDYKKELINLRFTEAVEKLVSDHKDINKKVIAQKIGISQSALSEILSLRVNVSAEAIAALAIHFDINPNWILLGEGPLYADSETIIIEKETCDVLRDKMDELDAALANIRSSLEKTVLRATSSLEQRKSDIKIPAEPKKDYGPTEKGDDSTTSTPIKVIQVDEFPNDIPDYFPTRGESQTNANIAYFRKAGREDMGLTSLNREKTSKEEEDDNAKPPTRYKLFNEQGEKE